MEIYTPGFDRRSAAERLAQAEQFEHMAERFKANAELSAGFRKLAKDAREQVNRLGASANQRLSSWLFLPGGGA